jgi:hypothetical protein
MTTQALQQRKTLSDKAEKLRSHLSKVLEEEGGEAYIKGKFIAEDVGLSAKEIGALMVQLKDADIDITIEKWSYTGATTWRLSR